jgi:predicted homoserine dehydrogenase-like protein
VILVDTALRRREEQGHPIHVALIGAGFMAQGLANQIAHSVPGMRVAAIYARRLEQALGVCEYAALGDPVIASSQAEVEDTIRANRAAATDDAFLLCRAEQIDVLVDLTGSVEFGAHVVLEAARNGKHIVLMNAELDATVGPILKVYTQRAGVIMSACDGDEPGLQMNLVRWVQGLGLTPRVMGNVKGLQDRYRNPETQRAFAEKWGPEPGDGDFVRRRLQDQLPADDCCERHRL